MYTLSAVTLVVALAYAQAGGLGVGLAGSVDGGAIISGPSGIVTRSGLASVGPIAGPGLISAGVVPGAVLAGPGLGLGLGGRAGLAVNGLGLGLGVNGLGLGVNGLGLGVNGLGLGINGLGLGVNAPGLAAKVLGLEGSGIEGQWIPDINEKLHDDGSYRPGLDH